MKLRKQDQEFRNPKVFYPDPKNIDLDRVLITLFLLHEVRRDAPGDSRGRPKPEFEKAETHLADACRKCTGCRGFDDETSGSPSDGSRRDIFDLVNRGRPTEAIASLRPLHLDAHKIRVAKYCRDYNHADALYAMLESRRVARASRICSRGTWSVGGAIRRQKASTTAVTTATRNLETLDEF